jgi:hypothetical protein
MPTDADKIAAATLAAAMLRRIEPTGSLQEDAKLRDQSIRFADRLYRDMLTTILTPGPEAMPTTSAAPSEPTSTAPSEPATASSSTTSQSEFTTSGIS